MQVTSTGIAIALAVVVALGLLFFGPRVFAPFTPGTALIPNDTASSTIETRPSSMDIPNPLPTELTAADIEVGTGAEAVPGKSVTVHYVGMLPDGTVFDASAPRGQAFTFNLGAGQVIQGWERGVVGMKEGGKRRLIIPPELGYGEQGAGGVIPPNATLIFDVELVEVR